MKNYFIESAAYGVNEGGFGCGPCGGFVVAEAKVRTEDGESFFFSLAEVAGIPNAFKTEISTLQPQLDMDDWVADILHQTGLEVGEYEEIFEAKDPEWFDLLRYMIFIVRAPEDDADEFIKETTGKWLSDIEIPVSDIEEEYDGDLEEDEEDCD